MPPVRSSNLPAGLEEYPGNRILCRICTDRDGATQNVIFLRTSRHGHLSSQGHKQALEMSRMGQEHLENSRQPAEPQTRSRPAPKPVVLLKSIIDHLAEGDSDDEGPREADDARERLSGLFLEDGMVFDGLEQVYFTAGDDPDTEQRRCRQELKKRLQNLAWYQRDDDLSTGNLLSVIDEPDDELNDVTWLAEDDDVESVSLDSKIPADAEWAPHGSKTMFMLDLLDHLPRLRLSDDHLRAVIWIMRECGTPDVPTFSTLRKMQSKLDSEVGLASQHHTSSLGNHFYMNHPAKLLALDWANPMVRKEMNIYPEIEPEKGMSEMWHGRKWTAEASEDELTPMWCDWNNPGSKHFYIQEITELDDGTFAMPLRWTTRKGIVHAESYRLHYSTSEQCFSLADPAKELIPASSMAKTILDLQTSKAVRLRFSLPGQTAIADKSLSAAPNPLRRKANGKAIYRIRAMTWSDDVSGNVSKQYNAHTNVYVQNLSLPHKLLSQEYFVRFSSTSSHASSSEQLAALVNDFQSNVWHEAYDCWTEQEILFQLIPHVLPADNPQQSEHASHIGGNGQMNCRRDKTGGSSEQKETDDGYCALFEPGADRQIDDTVNSIKEQIRLACYGSKDLVQLAATQSGVKDKIAQHWIEVLLDKARQRQQELLFDRETRDPKLNERMSKKDRKDLKEKIKRTIQTELWSWIVTQPPSSFEKLAENDSARKDIRPGDHYNILLSIPAINPHRDTPVELLHTWLLGNSKYIWHATNTNWDSKSEELFATRLQASDLHGLTTPPPRASYLLRYKNSLIGKHFKILGQLAVFHLHDLCSDLLLELWKASGELGAFLWFPEIHNLEEYLADLQVLIDNLLNIWAQIDPGKIVVKVKLHLLTHLVDDIRRFGPAILYETEVFECWNAIFRLCSILSNHLSPSKDISQALAEMERFKHLVSGGWWRTEDGQYHQAGPAVRTMLSQNSELRRRLGWANEAKTKAGSVQLMPRRKSNSATWTELAIDPSLLPPNAKMDQQWDHCKHVVSQSHDICTVASWVFYKTADSEGDVVCAGRIVKILAMHQHAPSPDTVRVWIQPYSILDERHPKLNMPVLSGSIAHRHLVSPVDILFAFNAQHDCIHARCEMTRDGPPMVQERMVTSIRIPAVVHGSVDRYVINMHALHNPHLLRHTLPRDLTKPVPYSEDNGKFRRGIASQLRVIGPQKRADTREKAKATRAKNAQKKKTAISATNNHGPPPPASSTLQNDVVMEGDSDDNLVHDDGDDDEGVDDEAGDDDDVDRTLLYHETVLMAN